MNIYLLTSGITLLGLCLLHIFFGEKNYFNTKDKRYIAGYVPYHQISVVMLLQGFGLIYSALYFNLVLPAFILFLTIGNLLTFVIICVKEKETGTIKASAPQFILFAIVLILIVLGLY